MGYSNKAHDGFLGNSVIGEWCNLGAGTHTSNLKNNYSTIQVWNFEQEQPVNTGLQFCGLFMGDHSKCGINSMFNAGTVVGVHANLYGTGYYNKFVPSFTQGGPDINGIYPLGKALETAKVVMQRRGKMLTDSDQELFDYLSQEGITDWIKSKL